MMRFPARASVRLFGLSSKLWHWISNNRAITVMALLISLVAAIPTIDFIRTAVSPFNVGVNNVETSNLSSIAFEISNDGKFNLENVQLSCVIDNMTVERTDGRQFRVIFDPTQFGWINSAPAQIKIAKLAVGDSTSFECNAQRLSGHYRFGERDMPTLSVRLRVMASYELPLIHNWKRCFVSQVFSCGDVLSGSKFCRKGEVLSTEVDTKKASDWGDLSLHFGGNPPWCGTVEPIDK
jgi:hypothetical protein